MMYVKRVIFLTPQRLPWRTGPTANLMEIVPDKGETFEDSGTAVIVAKGGRQIKVPYSQIRQIYSDDVEVKKEKQKPDVASTS